MKMYGLSDRFGRVYRLVRILLFVSILLQSLQSTLFAQVLGHSSSKGLGLVIGRCCCNTAAERKSNTYRCDKSFSASPITTTKYSPISLIATYTTPNQSYIK